jgi:regulatory protein
MKITSIKPQVKRAGRYSIFIDERYSLSLSANALLDSRLHVGQELDQEQVKQLKQASVDDKLYENVLRYLAIRPRTTWEITAYLQKKGASPALQDELLNKLSNANLLDDKKFAEAFVNDRRLLRPTSRRKITQQLRQKRVSDEIIQAVVGNEAEDEQSALQAIIERKRRQAKYKDDLKLMQYLAGQGFNYGDIKAALSKED